MPLALTGGQKLGIAVVALAFVAFALLSAFVLPRRNPDFPGRGLRLFVVVTLVFFVAMMSAMVVLAREAQEDEPGTGQAAHGAGETAGTTTQEAEGTQTNGDAAAEGNPEAGESVFADAGCGGCHALEEAGSTGAAGPSLDEADTSFDEAVEQIRNGGGGMPPFEGRLSDEQIRDVASFVVASSGGS